MRITRKAAVGVVMAAAVVATPSIAQAATWIGTQTNFTTASSGSKVGSVYARTGSIGLCGDVSNSSTLANVGFQIYRDIQIYPDTVQTSVTSTYNAGTACTPYFTGTSGEGYYNRGWWVASENPYHSGWFKARVP